MRYLREGAGLLLVLSSLSVLYLGVGRLRQQDYVGAFMLCLAGIALVRGGVELLRSSMGE